MSELLTTAEYKAIAAGLELPQNAFIDGGFRPAVSGQTFQSVNPATGEVLTEVAACGAEDVDLAVATAREAFEDGRWSRLHPAERKEVLIRLARLMDRNARELAVMESLDSGKTIYDCETVDVPEAIHVIKWHAELIDKIYDQVSPASDNHIAMILREPVGVVGLVLPWNFPLLMLAWKIGPALAAGCSVVVKPAAETTLTTLRVAELAVEAGLPRGVPKYVTIDSIEQLNENADKFGGKIIGIEPGSGLMREAADAVDAYGLELQLVEGSTAAMTAALKSATDRQEWIAVTLWEPTWMALKFDTKFLADPKGIFAPPQGYYWIGQKGFSEENPEAREIIASVYVPLRDIAAINAAVNDGSTMEQAVADWTEAHADLLTRWENIKSY